MSRIKYKNQKPKRTKMTLIIDKESMSLVSGALETAKQLLEENKDKLDILIGNLINKSTLNSDEFNELLEDCGCSLEN